MERMPLISCVQEERLSHKQYARFVEIRGDTVYCYAADAAMAWRVREKVRDMERQECKEIVIETGDNPHVARISVRWLRGFVVTYHGIRRIDLMEEERH